MKTSRAHRPTKSSRGSLFSSAGQVTVGLGVVACLLSTGCGNTLYLVQVSQAEEAFEEARELGAEQYSPYEYYAAEARLEEAKVQAAQAEYGNASDLSDEATDYAEKAIVNSKKSRNLSVGAPARVGVRK
jgi:hypothetical protein